MEYSTLNEQRSRKPENTAMTVRRMRSLTLAPVETTAMIGVLVSEFARSKLVARLIRMKAITPPEMNTKTTVNRVKVSANNWPEAAWRATFDLAMASLRSSSTKVELQPNSLQPAAALA